LLRSDILLGEGATGDSILSLDEGLGSAVGGVDVSGSVLASSVMLKKWLSEGI
jgi:hypothetical protein